MPAYADYLNHPLSEYHANNLAEALNNKVEWTYLYLDEVDRARLNGAALASFRTGLLTEHRALHVMSDLADAAQHRELTFERKPARVVTLSTDAYYEKEGVLFVKHHLRQLRHVGRDLYVPAHDCASRFHAGITPLDHQCSMKNIALNDSGAI